MHYLKGVLAQHNLSAREIARQSMALAEREHNPSLAFGHQAVSSWLNGTRRPSRRHRPALAKILEIPLAELSQLCDRETVNVDVDSTWRTVIVLVHGTFQEYQYKLALRTDIDLAQPAIFNDWTDMFVTWPGALIRHFRHLNFDLFGWIPDQAASPLVHRPRCLVPVAKVSGAKAAGVLDGAESSRKRVWFVYLPGGKLYVGTGYREKRSLVLARNTGTSGIVTETFPFSQVDLVGYFIGKILFHVLPAPIPITSGHSCPVHKGQTAAQK